MARCICLQPLYVLEAHGKDMLAAVRISAMDPNDLACLSENT